MKLSLMIIVAIAASLVMGPIMMLRPNPAQRRKEKLRAIARQQGVHFSLRNIPQQADELEPSAAVPVYFLAPKIQNQASNWMLLRTNYTHDIHFLGIWAWQDDVQAASAECEVLRRYLPQLPDSVRAVSGGGQGVSVYWTEREDEPVLTVIIELLAALNAVSVRVE